VRCAPTALRPSRRPSRTTVSASSASLIACIARQAQSYSSAVGVKLLVDGPHLTECRRASARTPARCAGFPRCRRRWCSEAVNSRPQP
jgi:hypothetical protein